MTASTFVKRFNHGDARERAQLFIEHDLKEPDINLMVPAPAGSNIVGFFFNGYLRVGAGLWYVVSMKNGEEVRTVVSAFQLHPNGFKTYQAWVATTTPQILNFCNGVKNLFIQAFHGAVMPEYTNN